MSYIIVSITLVVSILLSHKYEVISNILLIGSLIDSIFITRPMYKLYHNKYGYEVYAEEVGNSKVF